MGRDENNNDRNNACVRRAGREYARIVQRFVDGEVGAAQLDLAERQLDAAIASTRASTAASTRASTAVAAA